MTHRLMLALAVLLCAPLEAQQPVTAVGHSVHGVVFDSLAGAPLVGAVVQATSLDSTSRVFSAIVDTAGRYRIAGLPSGRFVIGVDHESSRALRLDAPLQAFELGADTSMTVDLGIPSGHSLHALYCADSTEQRGDGMMAGFVRDAERDEGLVGALVVAEWTAVALDPKNLRTVRQHATTRVDADGTYRVCGVPGDGPVGLRVAAPGYRPVGGEVTVPGDGAARLDFHLADTAATTGPATLRGRVMHENGRPVASGTAVIGALDREAPVQHGEFLMTGLPLGTWVVEVRSMGLEPRSTLVDLSDSGRVARTFAVGDKAQPLDAVNVIGSPARAIRSMAEVLDRKRVTFGTMFMPGSAALKSAIRVTDVFREARGFHYVGSTDVVAGRHTCMKIAIYINGSRWLGMSLRDVSDMIPVSEVLAMETLPDIVLAPPQWRTGDACAVVAIWTKR